MRAIKEIAAQLGCSYVYDDFGRINLHADQIKRFPLIAEVIPAEGTINTKLAPVYSTTRTTIVAFLTPCNLDFIGEQAGNKIDAMIALCQKFLQAYTERDDVQALPDSITYNAVLDFLDGNLCGIRITLPMTDNGGCVNG